MSRSFSNYQAKPTFGQIKEPIYASDYISEKKATLLFNKKYCSFNKNVYSQSNYLNILKRNQFIFNKNSYLINNNQLYINLITQLDLSHNIPIISDLSGNTYPVTIDETLEPYLKYNIDISGNLFGNTPCGLYNWREYLTYSK
jgi:hypothetical protein